MSDQDETGAATGEKIAENEPEQQAEANLDGDTTEQNGDAQADIKADEKPTEEQNIDTKPDEDDNPVTDNTEAGPEMDKSGQEAKESEPEELVEKEGTSGEGNIETSMQTDGRETPTKPDGSNRPSSQVQDSTSGPDLIAPPASQSDIPTNKQNHESFDIQGTLVA